MNDIEREQWVTRYEPLYNDWLWSDLPMEKFLRRYRSKIDAAVAKAVNRRYKAGGIEC